MPKIESKEQKPEKPEKSQPKAIDPNLAIQKKIDELLCKTFPEHNLHERKICHLFRTCYRINYMHEGWHKNSFFVKEVNSEQNKVDIWFDNEAHKSMYDNMLKDCKPLKIKDTKEVKDK